MNSALHVRENQIMHADIVYVCTYFELQYCFKMITFLGEAFYSGCLRMFFYLLRSAQNQRGNPPGHEKERNMSLLLKVTFAEQDAIREDLEEIDLNFIFLKALL